MGIIRNNKREYCTLKQNKEEKQSMTEGWITAEEANHIINVLRGYINDIYYTKEELVNLLNDSNIDKHVPKKVTELLPDKERRVYFKEEQLNKIIESIKDYINLHYVTKVEAELRFKEYAENKEHSCKCSGGCDCTGSKFDEYSNLVFKENLSDEDKARRAELRVYLDYNFDKLSKTYKDRYELLQQIRNSDNMTLSDKREWWGMIENKNDTLNKMRDNVDKK